MQHKIYALLLESDAFNEAIFYHPTGLSLVLPFQHYLPDLCASPDDAMI